MAVVVVEPTMVVQGDLGAEVEVVPPSEAWVEAMGEAPMLLGPSSKEAEERVLVALFS